MGPAQAPPGAGLLRVLDRFSLKAMLVGSTGLVLAFCVLVAVYLRASQGLTIREMDRLINVDQAISTLCLESAAAMTDARRLEKDYLLHYQEFGFDEAQSRYITRLAATVAEIGERMGRLRALSGDAGVADQAAQVEDALGRYLRGVQALAAKYRERGSPDAGTYQAMRAEAAAMESLVKRSGGGTLLGDLYAVRRAERYFIERERDADARAVAEAVAALGAGASRLPAGRRGELRELAGRYLELFERYVRASEEIWTIKREYLRSVQVIEPLLEALYRASLARVAERRRAVERSARFLSVPVLLGGTVVLVLVALFSLGIALAVTRGVVATRAFAERIAAGDLEGRLEATGRSEFAALAAALNTMAGALREADAARRRSTEALRESEERYRLLVEASSDWIWATDAQGRHTFTNDRVREILGREPGELLGGDAAELVHPEDLPRMRELLATAVSASGGWRGEVLRWRHRDGTWRWIESSAVPVLDAGGALAGFRGVDRDVTERRRLEEELARGQKLEAIGTLAGGIAHDFNNLLQGLFGYVSLARMSLDSREKADAMLAQAEKALNLSVNLTTQLLTFAKGGQPLKSTLDLREVIEDPVRFALSGSRSDYRLDIAPDLRPVEADGGQLAQVVQNLVINAGESMPQGGTVEVAARNASVPAGANPLVPDGGEFVRIDVRDSGAGIPGQLLTRIFDPYFTTKEGGSGLGLATSYSIVRNHAGFIDVSSRPGAGSVFSVYLPAGRGARRREPAAAAAPGGGTGRVLLMDDERLVREVAERMLAELGHAVSTAPRGEEAVELYRAAMAEGRPFDVVILDVTVRNGMGGEETLLRLRELDPRVRAVVSSGYADAPLLADFRSHGFVARLGKPYRMDSLRDCLAPLLEAAGRGAEV